MNKRQFPPDFTWGTATSSYQIEGSVGADGRGVSIWDTFSHTPGKTFQGDTGDIACDHYARWADDVELIADLGVNAYRFSIAWPRVQPDGRGAWNTQGMAFYDRLVDRLLERGIAPHVTLYHWDLPQTLQDASGWATRDTVLRFTDYALEMARRLQGRVAAIATHNEPFVTAMLGHLWGHHAPGVKDPVVASQVVHHLLLSHGMAVKAMREEGIKTPLGIVLNMAAITAATDSAADQKMAADTRDFLIRNYLDPLLLGEYPDLGEQLPRPVITPGDMEIIAQPIDFLGINYYFREWCSAETPPRPAPNALGVSEMGWEIYPQGIKELLCDLNQSYRLPPLYISENGMACADVLENGKVHDQARIDYVQGHVDALAQAIAAGVDLRGYFYWSLMDNFEWAEGYAKRFGLIHVDYATQQRTFKDSALWYRNYIQSKRSGAN